MSLLSNPRLYSVVQNLAGAKRSRNGLKRHLTSLAPGTRVLDLGGGTGGMVPYLPDTAKYACLDNEWAKLMSLRAAKPGAAVVLGDAANVPIGTGCIDVVLAIAVSHHLTDTALDRMLDEARRVLRPGGKLVFLDALTGPRLRTRLMWAIDRGSYPRSPEALESALARHLTVVHRERHAIWHEYLTMIGKKNGAANA